MRLTDKVAVITGATSGIGRVIAERFAEEGASLVVSGRRIEVGTSLATDLRCSGTEVEFVGGDVADVATADAIASVAKEKFGRIDILLLNAGTLVLGKFWEITPEDFDAMMRVNVRGVWLCARAAAPLLSRGASVIVMGSVSSFMATQSESVYGATKGAALQLTKGMALDLASRGIRVNALCPGAVGEVGMTQSIIDAGRHGSAGIDAMARQIPLRRLGTPREIADGAVFLASDDSSFMTGTSLLLDGGVLMQ